MIIIVLTGAIQSFILSHFHIYLITAKIHLEMANKSKEEGQVEIAPLRSLDDFILESARFQIPNYRDLEKWGNRVTSNLLYYQTNYFLLAILIVICVGVLHPIKMACGFLVMLVIFGVFVYITNERAAAAQFKRNHPIISLLLILVGGYFITYMLRSLLVFMFGILLPVFAIFIHSSLRLRNFKNKLVNKVETLGLKRSPMGIFLEELGLEGDLF
ncbi:PRA1 family protein 3 [Coccinella septempunctata]|uniref:PRA1 family protein 3 n=1 Tax=Coccinella septempunctata TaxID=41139 RepID=UPI001D065D9A|nr:PRA1 family protein 3 [Coccinella septempunctata]